MTLRNKSVDRLFRSILNLNNIEECYTYFEDLCTIKEIQDMAQRLDTAIELSKGSSYQEIAHCLDKSVGRIETGILHVLEQTPPELYSDIVENGIHLAGGGSLLRGLAKRLTEKVSIPFHVADDPLRAVARGTCLALKNTENYTFLMR